MDKSYIALDAMHLCLDYGLVTYFFMIAESRDLVNQALEILIDVGSIYLTDEHIKFFNDHYLFDKIKDVAGGAFIRSLPLKEQISVYIIWRLILDLPIR